MTKRFGFTLAEVLITLAIIGVVAALTMPSLINNTQGAQFKTAFKKAMSIMSQAVVMNIALDDYDLSGTNENNEAEKGDSVSLYALFTNRMNLTDMSGYDEVDNNNYSPYLTGDDASTLSSSTSNVTGNYVFYTNDGMLITFPKDAYACTEDNYVENNCLGFIDVNGTKGPNKIATCTEDEDGVCTSSVTINDIYPFKMYDQTIAPASGAGRAILFGRENIELTTSDD